VNLKIRRITADEVVIEFEGESHTLLNLLKTELLADSRVNVTTYDTKFPIMDNPLFRLKTVDGDPIVVLREAAGRIMNQCSEFSSQFAAAIR
jgi:DNA-directed RNA polymerase subunit L